MEEVDSIIIDTLKHLNCPIEDDILSLKQFDNDLVIKAIISCIDSISPDTGFPHILPISMSQRLKLATNIADHIKELGFRGDIGYQTILYCNEVEARRLLMFLIERLPREQDKSIHSDDTSRSSELVRGIKERISVGLKTLWLPTYVLRYGIRQTETQNLELSCGYCFPIETLPLLIPNSKKHNSEEFRQYCARHLPDVTKQCSSNQLIPSLLFDSCPPKVDSLSYLTKISLEKVDQSWSEINSTENDFKITAAPKEMNDFKTTESTKLADIKEADNLAEKLLEEVKIEKEKLSELQNEIQNLNVKKKQILETKNGKKEELEHLVQEYNIKSKSHTILSNNDNLVKLKLVIDNGNKKLLELTNQWHEVQKPLLNEYRQLQESSHMNESEVCNIQERLQRVKQKCQKAQEELREKTQLQAQLNEQVSKISKQTNRSAYTRRIMEIISNIKKQCTDIDKILIDTRAVQKEINTLNGQLERSFALSDEVIFRNARQEETSRKAYKLLATMHSEYEEVIQIVSELGQIIRETRNIQEQIDNEESKEVNTRLERVLSDLEQVRKETANLMKGN